MAKTAKPGFYDAGAERKRWWDGSAWTDRFEGDPAPVAAVVASTQALMAFTSHIDGKNAKVEIYADRLEWERGKISAFKVVTGVGFLTGFKNKNTDMLPMRQVTSVTSKKGLGVNTVVTVNSGAGRLEFRVSHREATKIRDLLNRLILEAGQPQTVVVQAAAAVQAAPDVTVQLTQLKSLLDAGVVTQEEYDAKKTEMLARL